LISVKFLLPVPVEPRIVVKEHVLVCTHGGVGVDLGVGVSWCELESELEMGLLLESIWVNIEGATIEVITAAIIVPPSTNNSNQDHRIPPCHN